LSARTDTLKTQRNADEEALVSLESLTTAFANLPARFELDTVKLEERRRDKEIGKRRLAELIARHEAIDSYLSECLEAFNRRQTDPTSLERMHDLLEAQAYRLAYWRVASHEINYRRFFDINDLGCLRMEDSAVFDATHGLILSLVATGKVGGLRVDHPDGLFDPAGYFRRLRDAVSAARRIESSGGDGCSVYVVAEKILGIGENLPENWSVDGTTGYDFASLVARLFIYPNGIPRLENAYRDFVGERASFAETAYRAKKLIMQTSLASELNVLIAELDRIAEADPHTRDFGLGGLRDALREVIACLPVYRCYVNSWQVSEADAAVVEEAVNAASRRTEAADTSVFEFIGDVLTLRARAGRGEEYRRRLLRFVMRLQQYTAPVAAKGVEDTALYRYGRLISLNEVGCHPDAGSLSIEAFHGANRERLQRSPHSMLASSTHDSKRSEDVRARIGALAEFAAEWAERVRRWRELNDELKQRTPDGETWPDGDFEYLLYQTLCGAWPLWARTERDHGAFMERIQAYARKAARETKVHTSWINPNPDYEGALESFIGAILDQRKSPDFIGDLEEFVTSISTVGMYTSFSQTLLKMTAPGVPDIYQGNELWRYDLVDPDNRRPVDFARRCAALDVLRRQSASETLAETLLDNLEDGAAKLYLIEKALALRAEHPRLFAVGEYVPLTVQGELQVYLCAFARRDADACAVVLAPRWFAALAGNGSRRPVGRAAWKDTRVELPPWNGDFRDVFTGATFAADGDGGGNGFEVAKMLSHFPVALLSTHHPADRRVS
jgi:(1->4)-alpha-D-glucan 1-alpha-D-glucosylmutase